MSTKKPKKKSKKKLAKLAREAKYRKRSNTNFNQVSSVERNDEEGLSSNTNDYSSNIFLDNEVIEIIEIYEHIESINGESSSENVNQNENKNTDCDSEVFIEQNQSKTNKNAEKCQNTNIILSNYNDANTTAIKSTRDINKIAGCKYNVDQTSCLSNDVNLVDPSLVKLSILTIDQISTNKEGEHNRNVQENNYKSQKNVHEVNSDKNQSFDKSTQSRYEDVPEKSKNDLSKTIESVHIREMETCHPNKQLSEEFSSSSLRSATNDENYPLEETMESENFDLGSSQNSSRRIYSEKSDNFEKAMEISQEDVSDSELFDEWISKQKSMNVTTKFFENISMTGRRIVDIQYLLQAFIDIHQKHGKKCAEDNLKASKVISDGLGTKIICECDNCNFRGTIHSEKMSKRCMIINKLAVLSTLLAGTGYEGLRQLCAGMNIPFMSHKTYVSYRRQLIPIIERVAQDVMREAAREEARIAINNGNVILDPTTNKKVPYINVEGDGGYGKRTYRSGKHDSLVCVGVVVGEKTKKVLHVEVRNKYCIICYIAAKYNRKPRPHRCFKNWSRLKSSSSMEVDCILKAFLKSIPLHNLIYRIFIGDGDAAVYKTLLEHDVYKKFGIQVGRLYCYNHLFRNMCNRIVDASKGKINHMWVTGNVTQFREFVKKSAYKVRKAIMFHVKQRNEENVEEQEKIKLLQRDILNVMNHVYGDHRNCRSRGLNCTNTKKTKNWIPILKKCNMFDAIEYAIKRISCFSKSLLRQVTTNSSENFMSLMAKAVDGKRVNFSFLDSYYLRCLITVIRKNTGAPFSTIAKYIEADLSIAEDMENEHKKKIMYNAKCKKSQNKKKRVTFQNDEADYGNEHQEPDVSDDQYSILVEHHLQYLKLDCERRAMIEVNTRAKQGCDLWVDKRRKLLTSSKFGEICNMKATTSCADKVKCILYPTPLDLYEIHYRQEMVEKARKEMTKDLRVTIEPTGFLIDENFPYLGATVDGKIGSDTILCVYAPEKAQKLTPLQAIETIPEIKRIFHKNSKNKINRKHNFYFQVQGQMHIWQAKYCYFVIVTPKGIRYVKETYDPAFWDKMKPKLTRFYEFCLLPEIVDPRVSRSMPVREPDYIMEAKEIAREKLEARKRKSNDETTTPSKKLNTGKVDLTVDEEDLYAQTTKASNADNIIDSRDSKDPQVLTEQLEMITFLNSIIAVNDVVQQVKVQSYMLVDDDIECFMNIVRRYLPGFHIDPVQFFYYRGLLQPQRQKSQIQIFGGYGYPHWCCAYYNGSELRVYDSFNRMELTRFSEDERLYLTRSFPHINLEDIIVMPVTQQGGENTCGVYAAAFVTDIVFQVDPSFIDYSQDEGEMRLHFSEIIRKQRLTPFPGSRPINNNA